MVALIASLFRVQKKGSETEVRRWYGILCGGVGIFLNLLLFAGKIIAGSLAHSVSITADAFNNLSDAGSSLISMIGFGLSGKAPDPEHPFGHGRLEYVAGLFVSVLILIMGGELMISSVKRIIRPESTSFGLVTVIILCASILVKLYMFFYNRSYGKKYCSPAMMATAKDSLSDCASTSVVLIATVVEYLTGFRIDSWCGLAIAILILYAGISSAKETLDPLLGIAPSATFVSDIEKTVISFEPILGIHDLIVHDYGPGRKMISLHAEVPCNGDLMTMHDVIDNIEMQLRTKYDCEATIHMDPIAVDDPKANEIRILVAGIVKSVSPDLKYHDLRIVTGPTHTNIIFDLLVPYDSKFNTSAIIKNISDRLKEADASYCAVIKIDRPYS